MHAEDRRCRWLSQLSWVGRGHLCRRGFDTIRYGTIMPAARHGHGFTFFFFTLIQRFSALCACFVFRVVVCMEESPGLVVAGDVMERIFRGRT